MPSRAGARSHVYLTMLPVCVAAVFFGGCGDERVPEKPKTTGSHVWRGQTDMLFEAREQAQDVNAQLRAQESALERARRGD
jgi:hypothetical protein